MSMNKISILFDDPKRYSYIAGSLFSYLYVESGVFYMVTYSKIQHTNSGITDLYGSAYQVLFEKLKKDNPQIFFIKWNRVGKQANDFIGHPSFCKMNTLGIYSPFQNDLFINEKELLDQFYEVFSLHGDKEQLVRGIMESRGSTDVRLNYLTKDVDAKMGKIGPVMLNNLVQRVFGGYDCVNINPRWNQPSKNSRSKNVQFRVRLDFYFWLLGCYSPLPVLLTKHWQNRNIKFFNREFEELNGITFSKWKNKTALGKKKVDPKNLHDAAYDLEARKLRKMGVSEDSIPLLIDNNKYSMSFIRKFAKKKKE